jgi:hypothetical protein
MTDASSENVNRPITREQLYELVWAEPMLKVAKRFDVSASYMARVCRMLDVPRPPRGYWSMLNAGKTPRLPPLPQIQPGTPPEWSKGRSLLKGHRQIPKPPSKTDKKVTKSELRSRQHLLIQEAAKHFKTGRLSREGGYSIPAKQLLLDLIVTHVGLKAALSFAKVFFSKLVKAGYPIVIADQREGFSRKRPEGSEMPAGQYNRNNLWGPLRPTVVYIGTVAIGITIVEMSEYADARYVDDEYVRIKEYKKNEIKASIDLRNWTTKILYATGRLCLQAYSPYSGTSWKRKWSEDHKDGLKNQVDSIITELEKTSVDIVNQIEEAERYAENRRREYEAQKEKERIDKEKEQKAKAIEGSTKELYKIIEMWAEAHRIEDFFTDAERRAEDLNDQERDVILERLKHARKLLGTSNALERFAKWKSPDEWTEQK